MLITKSYQLFATILAAYLTFDLVGQNLHSSLDISTIKEMKDSIRRGAKFLETNQDRTGAWSHSPDITALCLMALAQDPYRREKTENNDVLKARAYASEFLVDVTQSSVAGNDKDRLASISLCLTALTMSGEIIEKNLYERTVRFLTVSGKDIWKHEDPDVLPNLYKRHLILEALYIIENNPYAPEINTNLDTQSLWKTAEKFTKSCQILDSKLGDEGENQPGRFLSTPVNPALFHDRPSLAETSFELEACILTFAGIKSLLYCGVPKSDSAIKLALKQLQTYCPVKKLPARGDAGFFTYLYMAASTFRYLGSEFWKQSFGMHENTNLKIVHATLASQKSDGSWMNSNGMWRENDPFLCTAYAILTLANIAYAN